MPLVCEIKSRFDGDMRLADRAAALAERYDGPLAFKSFDPAILAHLRGRGLTRPLGIVAEADYDDPEWATLSAERKRDLAQMLHFGRHAAGFPVLRAWATCPTPSRSSAASALGLPVMTWTVRTPEQRQRAATWADQMVFEGFLP